MLHKKQKASPKTTKTPDQTQKALTKNHKKAPPPQRPKPHHLMKCEQGTWRSHVPCSHFGGRGGTGPPTKKIKKIERERRCHRRPSDRHFGLQMENCPPHRHVTERFRHKHPGA